MLNSLPSTPYYYGYIESWANNLQLLGDSFDGATVLFFKQEQDTIRLLCGNTEQHNYEQQWRLSNYPSFLSSLNNQELVVQEITKQPFNTPLGNFCSLALLPVLSSDNKSFGLLCLLDNQRLKFESRDFNTFYQSKQLIEKDLLIISLQSRLDSKQHQQKKLQLDNNKICFGMQKLQREKERTLDEACHEIRTALNGIMGPAQLMLKSTSIEERKQYLAAIFKSNDNILGFLEQNTSLSNNISNQDFSLNTQSFDLKKLIIKTLSKFKIRSDKKKLPVTIEYSESHNREFIGDVRKIYRILYCFLDNAFNHTAQGRISIKVSINKLQQEGQQYRVCLSVSDTGTGITTKQQKHLLDDNNNQDPASSLHRSKQYLRLMGGDIGVDSLPGVGTIFWASMPLQKSNSSAVRATTSKPSKKLYVLVAEDNPVNTLVLKGFLKRLNHQAEFVENGQQAFEKYTSQLKTTPYDLIILDCEMPVMDGYQASKKIRQFENENALTKTPILAISAHAMDNCIERCFTSGMDQHLAKPVKIEVLESTLQQLL